MKISHRELELCRSRPIGWAQTKLQPSGRFSFGYGQAVQNAINLYHRTNDANAARTHLETLTARFKNSDRISEVEAILDAYLDWHVGSGVIIADSNVRLTYSVGSFLELGGIVSRLDVVPSGYRAVILGAPRATWRSELRMPLIQAAISQRYSRPVQDITVGTQNVDGSGIENESFDADQVAAAIEEFQTLGSTVQAYFPNRT